MLNNKSELTNWAQNTKQKTLIGTKIRHKNPQKNPIFVVRKWAPQEVVPKLTLEVVPKLTLEVVPKLTLERPKRGTKTNSPAYIYIYIYKAKARQCAHTFLDSGIRFFLTGWLRLRVALGLRVAHQFGFRVVLRVSKLGFRVLVLMQV